VTKSFHSWLTWSFAFIFIVAAAVFAYTQQVWILLLPVIVLAAVVLLQHPDILFYLLLISIPWSVEYNFNPRLGTDLPDEPLMLLMALSIFIWFLYRGKINGRLHPVLLLIVLQLIWTVVTVLTSSEPLLSLKFLLAKCWYLLAFVAAPVFLFKNKDIIKRSAVLLLSSMMICMIVALIRHQHDHWTFEKVNDAVQPFFHNHVNYSALLVFMVPLLLAAFRLTASKKWKSCLFILMTITIIALYFSYARGAWLALVLAAFSYGLLRRRLLMPVFLLFIFLSGALVFWVSRDGRYLKFANDYQSTIFHKDFREHLIATYELKDVSTAERFYRWVAGIRMAADNRITGFGPTSFYRNYKSYTQPAFKTWVSRNEEQSTVHNYFLLVLIEQGWIGLLFLVALLSLLFYTAQVIYHRTGDLFWKVTVMAASAILVMECVVNFLSDMIETDKAGSVFYLCVAVIVTADIATRKKDEVQHA
jgi:O-antigen ligase